MFALRKNDVIGNQLRIDEAIVDGRPTQVKTAASEDAVFIPPGLAAQLHAWMECLPGDEEAWLFPASRGGPWDHHNYLDRVLKPAGVVAKIGLAFDWKKTKDGDAEFTSDLNFQILRRTSRPKT